MNQLMVDNLALLERALDLVGSVDEATYCGAVEGLTDGSIGDHIRHVVEAYECLLSGLATGHVDYDARRRDPAVATRPTEAARAIRRVMAALGDLHTQSVPPALHVAWGTSAARTPRPVTSSLARELAFVHAHTVHHFALIAMLLRARGIEPGADFGVAPATIVYRRGAQAHAAPPPNRVAGQSR